MEIDTRYHTNVQFFIRDDEGKEKCICLGVEKVAVIMDQLVEWFEERPVKSL